MNARKLPGSPATEPDELVEVEGAHRATSRSRRRREAHELGVERRSACGRSAGRAPSRGCARSASATTPRQRPRERGLGVEDVSQMSRRRAARGVEIRRARATRPLRVAQRQAHGAERRFGVETRDRGCAARPRPCARATSSASHGITRNMPPASTTRKRRRASRSRVDDRARPRASTRSPAARQDLGGDGVALGAARGHDRPSAAIVWRAARGRRSRAPARRCGSRPKCSSTSGVSSVRGPRPSASRTTAVRAWRPIQKPDPSSPSTYPQPPARAATRRR